MESSFLSLRFKLSEPPPDLIPPARFFNRLPPPSISLRWEIAWIEKMNRNNNNRYVNLLARVESSLKVYKLIGLYVDRMQKSFLVLYTCWLNR
jgi:hypothetical protein